MNYKLIIIFFVSICLYSCSSSSDVSNNQNFKIDYYTMGGFAGRSSGFTINSNGKVHFWNGATAANRAIKDSTNLDKDAINKIAGLLQDSTIYSYNYLDKGNLTSVLKINSDNGINSISYSGTVPPKEFPKQIKSLINELNKVSNKK